MIPLIKMNIKLLLRNKGFLFFLLAMPILSAFILNTKMESEIYREYTDEKVIELTSCKSKAVYVGNTSSYIVKVYDASHSELSEYILRKMASNSMFSICRCDVGEMTEEGVTAQAKKDAFDDRAGVLLYLKKDFDSAVLTDDWERGLQIYSVSEDEREELFETELTDLLGRVKQIQTSAGEDSGAIVQMLENIDEKIPQKETVSLVGKNDIALTNQQVDQKKQIGYAFSIITLGFLFCGVCVAYTVIEEQNNKVYTRVMLSKVGNSSYFISKFMASIFICVVQTFVLAICLSVIKDLDIGIPMGKFLVVIFLLGLIFSILSMLLGIMLGDVMSANYASFAIWSISALLSGLYFPLDHTTAVLKAISYLMPQKWFMDASGMLLAGDKGAYSMLLYVTASYLIIIISVGSVGLKIKKQEA